MLRLARKWHRTTGALLFVLFLFISISGLLLGWKKHSAGVILPRTQRGTTDDLRAWLPLDSLHTLAQGAAAATLGTAALPDADRIDVRRSKGVVKFVFAPGTPTAGPLGVQLDGATGEVLQVQRRYSDVIESIHDGSVVDGYLGTGGWFKLFYTTVTGAALLLFTITGFWLWYGPKRMRRAAKRA